MYGYEIIFNVSLVVIQLLLLGFIDLIFVFYKHKHHQKKKKKLLLAQDTPACESPLPDGHIETKDEDLLESFDLLRF